MENKKLYKIPSKDNYTFFRRILEVMGVFAPITNLSNVEKNLLAKLMGKRVDYIGLPESKITSLLLNKEGKNEIMEDMGYGTKQVLENMLTTLRKKGVLHSVTHKEPSSLKEAFRIDPSKGYEIVFKFDKV